MNAVRSLFARFERYHAQDRPMLFYVACTGLVAIPLLYLLRFTKAVPPYDDIWLRAVSTLMCAALALRARWPERLKRYYLPFAYAALVYCLPFVLVFTSLANGGGVVAVANTLMAVFFLILLADWRNTLVMLALGAGAATLAYVLVTPDPALPRDYIARIPVMLLVVLGGSIFKFTEKQAELRNLERSYAALAASIAHEMRNPLSQIAHGVQSMRHALHQHDLDPATRRNLLDKQLTQSELSIQRGLRVIAMILDEVSAKPMEPARFSLIRAADATRKAVADYGYDNEADRARVSVEVGRDFMFRGDETAYLYVLFNLIKNALYYVVPDPQARVRITVDAGAVRVYDNGPGLAPDVRATLFEPFHSGRKTGGTGLGLAYCRRVMQAFGGEIGCESAPGRFTQFSLRFPPVPQADLHRAEADAPPEAAQKDVLPKPEVLLAGRTILVADDSEWNRRAAAAHLVRAGARVVEAAHGAAVLDYMRTAAPCDAILMDVDMPGMSGIEAARRLRAAGVSAQQVPVFAITAYADAGVVEAARAAGIQEVLVKPVDPALLHRKIYHCLPGTRE
ncbi:MAG: hybrid sensor histidine kinase/response regulator [Pseudomonadota bacterium]